MKTVFFLLLTSISCFAQKDYFDYSILKSNKCSFPIFKKENDTLICPKINHTLQLSELKLLKGSETKNVFEVVRLANNDTAQHFYEMEFSVLNNSSTNLSIYFKDESCTGLCFYWKKYYNFNSQNGDLIHFKELFNEKMYSKLRKSVEIKRLANLNKEIVKINVAQREKELKALTKIIKLNDFSDFYIKNNSIFIDAWNYLSKEDKELDIDMITELKLDDFKEYLSEFGRFIFGLPVIEKYSYTSTTLPQLFTGTIAGEKIIMYIDNDDIHSLSGDYAYLKFGKAIYLNGTKHKKNISLTEEMYDGEGEANGYIIAKYNGSSINGKWIDKTGIKTHKIEVYRK